MKRFLILLSVVAVVAAVYFLGIRPHRQAKEALNDRLLTNATLPVNVIVASTDEAVGKLTLPASLNALQEAPIFARTSGYLARYFVDIGDQVKAGQTLALIDAPEVEQELMQARAVLGQTKANVEIARISAKRWKDLAAQNAVSKQEADEKQATMAANEADVLAAEANVSRLTQLKQYQTITAPFDGVITARNIDVGALVSSGGSGKALFHLSQTSTLRVYINIPQAYYQAVKPGLPVDITISEFPSRIFKGEVRRISGALDPETRTLVAEVQIPNEKGELLAGMFGQVVLALKNPQGAIIVPSSAVILRNDGTHLAIVDKDNKIQLVKVALGRDFGTKIEVLNGLTRGDHVVNNPSDALANGLVVTPIMPAPAKKS